PSRCSVLWHRAHRLNLRTIFGSVGWKQFVKQASQQLLIGLRSVLLHIPLFSGANRIGICVRYESSSGLRTGIQTVRTLLHFLRHHDAPSHSVTRSAQVLEQAVKVV